MRATIRGFLLLAALPAVAGAQQWRTIETARQLPEHTGPLDVTVTFAAGNFRLAPLAGELLYQMRLKYDEQAMDAVHEYDASEHRLKLGLDNANVGWRALRGMKHHEGGEMSVGLSREVPMNLGVELGGAEAKLELGGLKIRKLHLESGLAGSKVSFSTPNQVPMERMSIELGLGGVQFEKLGNANVAEINIDGGMGAVSLDFGDVVGQDVKITSNVAFGELRVAVPANVGVLVEGELKAGKFERHIAFKQMGNAWYSMNWQDASQHITIVAHTTVGSLKIVPTGQ